MEKFEEKSIIYNPISKNVISNDHGWARKIYIAGPIVLIESVESMRNIFHLRFQKRQTSVKFS